MHRKLKVSVEDLAPTVDPDGLGFRDTSELGPLTRPIGQDRAVEALEFGLAMPSSGFNIYVAGPVGTGKETLVRQMVQELAKSAPTPHDWCYVNNFLERSRPRCLSFPAGQGRVFKEALDALVESLRREIPKAFETSTYLSAKARILEETDARKKALFNDLAGRAQARGFGFEETPIGFRLVPLRAGHPISEEDLESLSERARAEMEERRRALEGEIREFQATIHALSHEAEQRLRDMDREVVRSVLSPRFAQLYEAYQDEREVLDFLQAMQDDVVSHFKDFFPHKAAPLPLPGLDSGSRPDLTRYQVNVVVEHRSESGAPVVFESHPTYANLIGRIERKSHMGVVFTDFTEIRAGALLQANGGYLVLQALDLLRQPFAWEALKRVIKTGQVKIEDAGEFHGFTTAGLQPEPIPVTAKVILLGPPILYHVLQAYEADFQKIFKVKADFDVDIVRGPQQDRQYAQFVAQVCRRESLPNFTAAAVAEVIRQGIRLAERRDRLSLRFSSLSDLIREAAFWARREGRLRVTETDVEQAAAKKRYRSNLPEQWVQDEITEGTLIVDLRGEVIGQVNGISVHQLGDYAFGRPCRITARTYAGTKGVIDVQREAELAGHVHSKGVLTLAGYLAGKFAGMQPFALNASLTFEQTYTEVEGDSAAAAELAAIISSLAAAPVRQALAVTGSINQLGEIQPIGSVNEKIEGFFESCRRHGLTGAQGVIIPVRNIKHLALRRDVVDAVKAGEFSVYAVDTAEEALELLMGIPCGKRGPTGRYPTESLFGRVAQRLAELTDVAKQMAKADRDSPA